MAPNTNRKGCISPSDIDSWLEETVSGSPGGPYFHRLLREQARDPALEKSLLQYVHAAHEDAREKVRKVLGQTLTPFIDTPQDPAYGYPAALHERTLMGYWGEILAGLIAENKQVHGKGVWEVPAYFFRFHHLAFQQLEKVKDKLARGETFDFDDNKLTVVGRTGNDVLAFQRTPKGELAGILVCEAKCFESHNMSAAHEAHQQLSEERTRPYGILQLIEILNDYGTPESTAWRDILSAFFLDPNAKVPIFNMLSYACGNRPAGPNRLSWLSNQAADQNYKGKRPLEVVEIQLNEPEKFVKNLYRHGIK